MSKTDGKNIEVADVFRIHRNKLKSLSREQKAVIDDIVSCRTAELGGHVLVCDECGNFEISYNSCRNRHCPKCQSFKKELWISDRMKELLPVHYFHIVFTIPKILSPIALQNKETVYSLLFKAASDTLKEVAANPKNLNSKIGFISILHTWDQKLGHHPHIHSIVPGGGISTENDEWKKSPKNFFLSVKVLSSVFRGKFLSRIEKAFDQKRLNFWGDYSHLSSNEDFKNLLHDSCKTDWVVYSKPPFKGPGAVVKYLGRYTHRIAISNYRIKEVSDTHVTFTWRDRKNGNKVKTIKMDVVSFMKRFLLHILPSGFMKIRYYGFLGNARKKENLQLCLKLLGNKKPRKRDATKSKMERFIEITGVDPTVCCMCKIGHMVVKEEIPAKGSPPLRKTG